MHFDWAGLKVTPPPSLSQAHSMCSMTGQEFSRPRRHIHTSPPCPNTTGHLDIRPLVHPFSTKAAFFLYPCKTIIPSVSMRGGVRERANTVYNTESGGSYFREYVIAQKASQPRPLQPDGATSIAEEAPTPVCGCPSVTDE